jgi:hypothetical protein
MAVVDPAKDTNEYIFKPEKKEEQKQEVVNKYYTLFGYQDYLDSEQNPRVEHGSKKIFAMSNYIEKPSFGGSSVTEKYLIKVGPYGKIYNPIGLYSEGDGNKFSSKTGKQVWGFKEVNSKVFNMYVSFLKSKNIAWLNNAERELS